MVRSYSFADIMTRDKYVAFKIVHAVDQGIFYKAAKNHSDIFNTFVDMMRQKLSRLLWQILVKLNTEKTVVKGPILLRTGLPRLF